MDNRYLLDTGGWAEESDNESDLDTEDNSVYNIVSIIDDNNSGSNIGSNRTRINSTNTKSRTTSRITDNRGRTTDRSTNTKSRTTSRITDRSTNTTSRTTDKGTNTRSRTTDRVMSRNKGNDNSKWIYPRVDDTVKKRAWKAQS